MITITVKEVGNGRGFFEARLGPRLLCLSRTPLLSAARILLEDGHLPDDEICMQHIDSATVSIKTRLGAAAKLTVMETGSAPVFRAWKAFQPLEGRSPARSDEEFENV